MKKVYAILFSLCLILSLPLNAFAMSLEDKELYQTYILNVEEGYIDQESVSYEMWSTFIRQQLELEEELSNSEEFELVYSSDDPEMYALNSSYTSQPGDVYITNATVASAIVGHAGIVVQVSQAKVILHTYKGITPDVIGPGTWHNIYTNETSSSWTHIYRHTSSSVASAAANWAKNTYLNSGAAYLISTDLVGTNTTYCSKIVYQAYRYGPSTSAATTVSGIVGPYLLDDYIPGLEYIAGFDYGDSTTWSLE